MACGPCGRAVLSTAGVSFHSFLSGLEFIRISWFASFIASKAYPIRRYHAKQCTATKPPLGPKSCVIVLSHRGWKQYLFFITVPFLVRYYRHLCLQIHVPRRRFFTEPGYSANSLALARAAGAKTIAVTGLDSKVDSSNANVRRNSVSIDSVSVRSLTRTAHSADFATRKEFGIHDEPYLRNHCAAAPVLSLGYLRQQDFSFSMFVSLVVSAAKYSHCGTFSAQDCRLIFHRLQTKQPKGGRSCFAAEASSRSRA